TGSLKWTYPKAPQTGESSPALFLAVDNGVVYVVPSGSSSTSAWNTVAALDAATGTLKWRSVTLGGNLHPPAVAGGIVYVSSYVSSCCSYLYALDAATGDLKWTYTRWGAYGFNDPPVVADGLVYVAKDGGLVYAFEAQPPPVSVSVPSYVPASFTVSWAVPTIWTGTAAASYDVQYRDGTTAAWTDLITATTTASTTFSGGPEGHTYYFRARASITTGAVGDWSDPVSITVDLTPPTGSLSISNGVTYATSITATLNVTATDATSGVADVSLSNDGSAWSSWDTYAPAKTWLLASGDGPKTVYGRFRDLASNVSAVYSDTIILDTAPPQTPTPDDGVAGVSSNPSLTFAWPATNDNFSGVDAYYWKTDCGLVTATTSLTATTSVLPDGQHTFYVRARDLAGNYSPYGKHTFTIKATSLDPPILNSPTSPT
ncbi:MAG: PQQ-binding-like beta-propeller repeat protein, partial [Dehalococcoidia bacterium]|nr:PQQ-binding-like beta-propeller repeat protein [Dehalococcoidia bacterium]